MRFKTEDLQGMTARPVSERKSKSPVVTTPVSPKSQGENSRLAMQALGRLKTGVMNKTEQAYSTHLENLKHSGEILWFSFEAFKLRLADNTFYTPDFAVLKSDSSLECHEVKGYWQDDARVKVKVAASMFPIRFIAVTAKSKKDGGGWNIEEF